MGYLPPQDPRDPNDEPRAGDLVTWVEGGRFSFLGIAESLTHVGQPIALIRHTDGPDINRMKYVSASYFRQFFHRNATADAAG